MLCILVGQALGFNTNKRFTFLRRHLFYNSVHSISDEMCDFDQRKKFNYMKELQDIIKEITKFRDERDWVQFHNSKDLALAISIEAAELNELFLWKSSEEVNESRLKEELADILTFSLLLADKHGLDISTIIKEKLAQNEAKYPVDKSKGSAKKYNEL